MTSDDDYSGPNPCGAHGCTLAPSGGGQRVNGGCRCSAAALRLAYLALRKERDEARARIARYVAAYDSVSECSDAAESAGCEMELTARGPAKMLRSTALHNAMQAYAAALAALRETPAGEGER